MHPGDQVRDGNAFDQSRCHFLLGPDGADVADLSRMSALERQIAHLFQLQTDGIGDHLDKTTASCRALVVHDKIGDPSIVIDRDGFAVLAADVYDGSCLREEAADPSGVAADLCDLLISEGAIELAEAVVEACKDKPKFKFLYPIEMKLRERVDKIAKTVYGANGVSWSPEAEAKAKMLEGDPKFDDFATMMVKTHLSLTHDPALKGVPKGWTLPVRDVLIYSGAKFLCPVAGTITLMPGTSSDPAFRRVDVDVKTGKVKGLF